MSAKRKGLSGHLLSWQDSRNSIPLPQHCGREREGPSLGQLRLWLGDHLWGCLQQHPLSQAQAAETLIPLPNHLYQRHVERLQDQLASGQPGLKPELSLTLTLFSLSVSHFPRRQAGERC